MFKYLIVGVAMAGISIVPAAARPVAGKVCFNCSNFGGSWQCETGNMWGGTSCTVTADSCSVSGNCNGPSGERVVAVGTATILEIAETHPRVAATVYELTKGGRAAKEASVFWNADAMSRDQVLALLAGGKAGLAETPGEAVIYDSFVDTNDAGGIALVIAPRGDFADDRVFVEFRLELAANDEGVLVPSSFSFR